MKVADLEREYSMVFPEMNGDDEMEKSDFRQRCIDVTGGIAVHFEEREKWLTQNGYELTRENLVNFDLPEKE